MHAYSAKAVGADVLRLDEIHPIVSGNKWFKLKYHLRAAQERNSKGIITFGGAYSNHLVAAAWAAKEAGLPSFGIIRGEEPAQYSPTLQDVLVYGMQLQFINRQSYGDEAQMIENCKNAYPHHFIIPQGGQSHLGVQGAAEILQLASLETYSHIVCAAGTGTMMAGICTAALPHQQVIGISSLKTENAGNNSITALIEKYTAANNWKLFSQYHFGGYAKHKPALLQFMNTFYHEHGIPSDFVYTGKLFFAIDDLALNNYFAKGSKLLIIHSGGLQGNRSLAPGTLTFL